jgi:glucose-6-phosphate 1-dehydrogenase
VSTSTDYFAESFLPRPARNPCVLVLFGGAGALAQRKLAPALYNLTQDKLLPREFALLASARTPRADEGYRALLRQAVEQHSRRPPRPEALESLLRHTYYQPLRVDRPADWEKLGRRLREIDDRHGTGGGRLLYLSTPPEAYPALISAIGRHGTAAKDGRPACRIVVEKPFGTDLGSAAELSALLQRWFDESAIYRIDHFLGKETVQNLLVFRFSNAIFEPLLGRDRVHDVQITVAEDDGVGDRGPYYETAGALRDMVQNHLLQLLCLIAMEPPLRMGGEAVRDEKLKVLRAIAALTPGEVARQTARGQ